MFSRSAAEYASPPEVSIPVATLIRRMPPAIWNAGTVILKIENISCPVRAKKARTMKAIFMEVLMTPIRSFLLLPSVRAV